MANFVVDTLHDEAFDGTGDATDGAGLSLREAVGLANGNSETDTITFAAALGGGTLRLTQGSTLTLTDSVSIDGDLDNNGTADITISGDAGQNDTTTTDPNGNTITDVATADLADNVRVFSILGGTTTLDGLVITGGQDSNGAGGIFVLAGTALSLAQSSVSGNAAPGSGNGGGIYSRGLLTISDSTISANTAGFSGGGLFAVDINSDSTISGVTISGNTAIAGGGLFLYGRIKSPGPTDIGILIENSTVSGNGASYGGGIFNRDGLATVRSSTISDNTANLGSGSGIASFGDITTVTQLHSTIVAGNTYEDLAKGFGMGSANFSGSNNLIGDGNGYLIDGTNGNIVGTSGARIDPMLGPLGDNGGPTATMAPLTGSQAIDAGANPGNLTTDQRGSGFVRSADGGPDIGAFETQSLSLVVTTLADEPYEQNADNANDGFGLSLREALEIANRNQGADTITFAQNLAGGTLHLTQGTTLTISDDVTIDGYVDNDGAPDITISGDAGQNDTTTTDPNGNTITDVAKADLSDNVRVFNILGGSAALDGLVITGGQDSNGAGGIFVLAGTALSLAQSSVSGNTATASGNGGGIYSRGQLAISDSTISANTADNGGGLFVVDTSSDSTISGVTISGNTATTGGGLYLNGRIISPGPMDIGILIENSTVSGNSASAGGSIYNRDGLATVRSSTISDNTANLGSGSGIASFGDITTVTRLYSTIVAGNTYEDLAQVRGPGIPDFYGSNNLIGDGNGYLTNGIDGNIVGSAGSKIDPMLALLGDNGGPTATMALQTGSQAIDAGSNPGSLTTDQRGTGFVRSADSGPDIGAFETQSLNLVVTTLADEAYDAFADNAADGNGLSLREAIEIANRNPGADTITFSQNLAGGTLHLTQGTTLTIGDSVTIDGDVDNDGAPDITISGDAGQNDTTTTDPNGNIITDIATADLSDNVRVFNILGGTTTLDGLVITGGQDPNGAGGIFVLAGTALNLAQSSVSGNAATGYGYGGGILARGQLIATDSTISANTAYHGGGIYSRGQLEISDSTVSANTAAYFGGGLRVIDTSGDSTISGVTISGNTANKYGGGLFLNGSINSPGPTDTGILIENSTISGNSGSVGGGIYNSGGLTTVRSSTISNNTADLGFGSGIASYGNSETLTRLDSTIVAGNTHEDLAKNRGSELPNFSGANNLIGDGNGYLTDGTDGNIVGTSGARIDPMLGPLGDNGGPTATMALQPGSQAIDAGSNPGNLTTDQRGTGFVRSADSGPDIGAFETQSLNLVVTTLTDEAYDAFADNAADGNGLSLREAIAIAERNPGADTITFAAGLAGGTLHLTQGTSLGITTDIAIEGDLDGDGRADITISGDAGQNDTTTTDASGNTITDVATADLTDNVVVFDLTAGTSSLSGLIVTGGSGFGASGVRTTYGAAVSIANSSISGNNGVIGGGVFAGGPSFALTDSTLSKNSAGSGGGLYIDPSSQDVTISGVTISENTASNRGGGLHLSSTDDPSSSADGVLVENTTIFGNTALEGGGIFNADGVATIRSTTISGNTADPGKGSGISSIGNNVSSTRIESTIVAGNTNEDLSLYSGAVNSFVGSNSLIGDGNGLLTDGIDGNIVGSAGSKIDPMLGPLAYNGGPTVTMALQAGSQAIDAGSNPGNLTTDQRGTGFVRSEGSGPDIGAFETQSISLVVTTLTDEAYEPVANNAADGNGLSLREALEIANRNPGADTITFAAELSGGTLRLTQGTTLTISDDVTVDGDIDNNGTADITISGDVSGNDTTTTDPNGNTITDVAKADLSDNVRVFSILGGSAALDGLVITGGQDSNGAGGIFVLAGTALNLAQSSVSGNAATASGNGGGIYSRGQLAISDSTISANTAGLNGGGLFVVDINSDSTISGVTISGNTATAGGGGLFLDGRINGPGPTDIGILIENSTVSGNGASYGGGILNRDGLTTVRSSTISDNTANLGSGSGIASVGNITTVTRLDSTIVAGNTYEDLAQVFGMESANFSGSNNLIGDGNGYLTNGVDGNIVGSAGSKIDPMLGPLGDNGGPTATMVLQAGSQAIDAGSNPGNLTTDQRGAGYARSEGSGPDIGAFESQSLSLVVTTLTDEAYDPLANNAADGNGLSLREALEIANRNPGADTITFAPALAGGTLRLTQGTTLIVSDDVAIDGDFDNDGAPDITISGDVSGNDTTTTDPNGNTITDVATADLSDNVRVFNILGGTTTLDGLVITGGQDPNGAGGIFVLAGTALNLAQSSVSGNAATGSGDGGGIYSRGQLAISDSTISANTADNGGGLFVVDINSDSTISGVTISGNTATADGGGLYLDGRINNPGPTDIGILIENSTVSGNGASYGGGIFNQDGLATVRSSTISDNTADLGRGSGIASYGNITTFTRLDSTIVAGNTYEDLAQVRGPGIPDFYGSNNLIGDGNGYLTNGIDGNIVGSAGSKIDPMLALLGDNGGPTATMALQTGSQAIDAGSNPGSLTTDQRGTGFVRSADSGPDIGAFETQSLALVVTTLEDEAYDAFADNANDGGGLSLREALEIANRNPGADTITFDAKLLGGTLHLTQGATLIISDDVTIDGDVDSNGTADITISGDAGENDTTTTDPNGNTITDIATADMSDNVPVIAILTGATVMDGLVVTGGQKNFGGAGIFIDGRATLDIANSSVSGNTSTLQVGGGIRADGALTITDSTVSGNSALNGGGIGLAGSDATIRGVTVSGNTATESGGGLSVSGTIVNPGPDDVGILIENSTVTGNSASKGGGFYNFNGLTTIRSSTITGNTANQGYGSGISSFADSLTRTRLYSTIVAGNANEDLGPAFRFFPPAISGSNNLIGDGNGYLTDGVDGNIVGTAGAPIDPLLGPLANNGGPTATLALLSGSPAIDAGANPGGLLTDQRGTGFDRTIGSATDIGAFEAKLPVFEGPLADGAETVLILEQSPAGTAVIDVDANDGNGNATDANVTYRIVAGNTNQDGDLDLPFAIDSLTGAMTVNDADDLDFETTPSFTLTVEADNGPQTKTATVTVNLVDISDPVLTPGLDNFVYRGNADQTVAGLAGADFIATDSGNDFLLGGANGDVLSAGAGNDTLVGGAGTDGLSGGAGNDSFVFLAADDGVFSIDVIEDFATGDTIDLFGFTAQTVGDIEFIANANGVIAKLSALQWVQFIGVSDQSAIEGQFVFEPGPGNIPGIGDTSQVRLSEGTDNFTYRGTAGIDVFALGGADFVATDQGADLLSGGGAGDILRGGAGNDTLIGGTGTDELTGGEGNDLFRFAKSDDGPFSIDAITDFEAGDIILLDGFDAQSFDELAFISDPTTGDAIAQLSTAQWVRFDGITDASTLENQILFI